MLAKVIARGPTRDAALDRLALSLEHTVAAGPRTNLPLLVALLRAREFRQGHFDTSFIERNLSALGAESRQRDRAAAAAGAARLLAREAAERASDRGTPVSP